MPGAGHTQLLRGCPETISVPLGCHGPRRDYREKAVGGVFQPPGAKCGLIAGVGRASVTSWAEIQHTPNRREVRHEDPARYLGISGAIPAEAPWIALGPRAGVVIQIKSSSKN